MTALRLSFCLLFFTSAAFAAAPPARPRRDSDGRVLPAGAVARLAASRARAVTFTSDGRRIYSCGPRGVETWDLRTERRLSHWDLPDRNVLGVTPAGDLLTTRDGLIDLRRGTSGVVRSWNAGERINGGLLSFDGKRLATTAEDRIIRVWNVTTGKEAWTYPKKGHNRENIPPLAFSSDSKMMVIGVPYAVRPPSVGLFFFDAGAGSLLKYVEFVGERIQVSPNFRYVATSVPTGRNELCVCLTDLARGLRPRPMRLDDASGGWPMAFSPDGRALAAVTSKVEIILFESASGHEILRFRGARDADRAPFRFPLTFSPDGRLLLSLGWYATLVWDITGRAPEGVLRQGAYDQSRLETLWTDLASQDAGTAWRAIWALVAAPRQALSCLSRRLRFPKEQPARLTRLIEELDSDDFTTRHDASTALQAMEDDAAFALMRVHESTSSAEVRHRAGKLLDRLGDPLRDGKKLREVRAVHVLEQIGTPEAKTILRRLEGTGGHTRLGQEAKAALQRLAQRPG